ncbi:MAG: redoxin domain-containing protein [Undibacterium sp.]|nr:redoxin domain-containing protein [Opitutaceae bacterium]
MNRRSFHRALFCAAALILPLALFAADTKTKGEKPRRVAFGETINLADYAVPGKTTVFDFTSHYCPPCEAIAPDLDKLHAKRADVVVVAVDINRAGVKGIDWKSPVAQQYGLRSIPHFKVYGPDGKLLAEDLPNDPKARQMVTKWFK